MIAVLKNGTTEKQLEGLLNWIESLELTVHLSRGDYQTIVGLVGDTSKVDADLLGSLDIVESVESNTTLIAGCNFLSVILKSLK